MSRPIVAQIDLTALKQNYAKIKAQAMSAKVWAVVKANAYGHGVLPIAKALQAQADGFALMEIEAACEMREQGIQAPILLIEGIFCQEELVLCLNHNLSIVIHNFKQIDWLEHISAGGDIDIFVKVNSGMNRLGFRLDVVDQALKRLQGLAVVRNITLMTHFATADESHRGIDLQWQQFLALADRYTGLAISVANSAAMVAYPTVQGQWVRSGILLYGVSPFLQRDINALQLTAVMSLKSELISIQTVCAGETVGYGATFTATKTMQIGIVACGYADGYPRHAPTGMPVLVQGQRCALVGRVSMDMLSVDVTAVTDVQIGSPVELWGTALSIDEVATCAGTISYELMCALTRRVPLKYLGN